MMKRLLTIVTLFMTVLLNAQSLRLNSGGNTLLFNEDTISVKANFFQNDALTVVFSDQKTESANVTFDLLVITAKGGTSPSSRSGQREAVFQVNRKELKKGSMLVITAKRSSVQDEVFVVKVE